MTATEYNKLNELLSDFSRVNAALETAEATIKTVQLTAAASLLPEHATLKVQLTELESSIRKLAETHYPALFEHDEKRTHQTPFGAVKFVKSSSLEFDDEEKVLLKIQLACDKEEARSKRDQVPPRFVHSSLVRTYTEPNLETLTDLDDATLAMFGITRTHKDNFSIKPFSMQSDKPAKTGKNKQRVNT